MELIKKYLLMLLKLRLKGLMGLTLLEMLISIGIMVLVAVTISTVFNQSLIAYRYSSDTMAVMQEAQMAMQWIINDIQSARDITQANSGDIAVVDLFSGITASYSRDAARNTIQRITAGGTPSLLAENAIGLSFQYYNGENVIQPDPLVNRFSIRAIETNITTQRNNKRFILNSAARFSAQ